MSGLPNPPRVSRGGLVLVEPRTGRPVRTIRFQYNPDSLSRTLAPQGIGSEPGDRLEALRLKGPAHETYRFDAEFDAADQLADPNANSLEATAGLRPVLAALESGLYPTVDQLMAEDRMAAIGMIEVAPVEAPLTVLVLGAERVLPVRITELSVTEDAFDSLLHPIRAKVTLSVRVLTVDDLGYAHRGGLLYLAHQRAQERFAAMVVRTPADLGLTSIWSRMFSSTSRYHDLAVLEHVMPDGTVVRYTVARLLPDPAGSVVVGSHVVAPGDRLDRIAAERFGDPEQAWRISDGHRVLDPDVLTAVPGSVVLFTLPAGLLPPGAGSVGVVAGG